MMIVFDVGNRDSFMSCTQWAQKVRSACGKACGGVLIANKTDFEENGRRKVSAEEGITLAKVGAACGGAGGRM